MKKILFLAVATVAMTFAACGSKQQGADAIDAEAVAQMTDDSQIEGAANQVVEALKAQIANADKSQVEAVIAKAVEAAQGLISNGNVAGASKYVQTVTNFISENQETLANLGIDTSSIIPATVTDAISAATTVGEQADCATQCAQEQVEGAVESAQQAAESAQQAAQQAVDQTVEAAQQATNQAAQQASQAAQQAVSNAAQQANEAVNQAAQQAIRRIPGAQQ